MKFSPTINVNCVGNDENTSALPTRVMVVLFLQKAVQYWTMALDMDSNQYIWRRRIQQYGPRLEKPYSFYD
jgi:hypothetical protein